MTVGTVVSTCIATLRAITSPGELGHVYEGDVPDDDPGSLRTRDGELHFWVVQGETPRHGGGAGYDEPVRQVTCRGFIGISTANDEVNRTRARDLQAAVVAAFRSNSFTLDVESVSAPPILRGRVRYGDHEVESHIVTVVVTILELEA